MNIAQTIIANLSKSCIPLTYFVFECKMFAFKMYSALCYLGRNASFSTLL